ncbi:peptidoglycan-binding domain-containing protein [Roseivivax isoporae]|uniref:Peptidoglycan-binding protein n=1 Tax=Roseivivax isoporae LMG 25204 TaxID=1449351 RepID=X7F6R6_9RHOB|nr:peptidoglycan-binding protein [Roseivivax isoporae]ETX28485.1 peptidoglycan-binding protein [Roseivivax isoporae LMG 25204]
MLGRQIAGAALGALLVFSASGARAAGDALIVGNGEYSVLDRLRGANRVLAAAGPLEDAGYDVVQRVEADAEGMREALAAFLDGIDADTDRVAVILSGRFVHHDADAYLLPVGADEDAGPGATVTGALPLSAVMGALAAHPGRAILLLGEGDAEDAAGPLLRAGAGPLAPAQGVSVVRGAPAEIAALAQEVIGAEGPALVAAAFGRGLTVSGYAPRDMTFPVGTEATPPAMPQEPDADVRDEATGATSTERATWEFAQAADTEAGYERYLSSYPDGVYATEARARLGALRDDDPEAQAEATEAALGLGRDARRDIQRDLTLLGFDTRGVDGIFGPGTRGAVADWQREEGFEATGFLDAAQVGRLDGQAARRQADLEEEARERRAAQEARDRAYWEETGAAGDEAGLRAYLERHPDGVFAEEAQEDLDAILAERRAAAAERDRADWERARAEDTVAAYRAYLEARPEGAFASEARAAIAAREVPSEERQALAQAEAQEASLNLNGTARRLAEDRLRALGLKPGEVDGTFDDSTRRAIRRYQDARSLRVTGYLDQATVVRLLADSLLGSR